MQLACFNKQTKERQTMTNIKNYQEPKAWSELTAYEVFEIHQLDQFGDLSCFTIDKIYGTWTEEGRPVEGCTYDERIGANTGFASVGTIGDDVLTYDEKVYDPDNEKYRHRNNRNKKNGKESQTN